MISRPLEFRAPTTLTEALDALAQLDDEDALPLAGGMSLVPLMNLGLRRPSALVSLNHVEELRGVDRVGDAWRVGAMTRHAELARHAALGRTAGALAEAARGIGDRQVRNRGTIGGSVAQAEPFADYMPVLFALDAHVELASGAGTRSVPVAELVRGAQRIDLEPGELIAAVVIPDRDGAAVQRRLARTAGSAPLVTAAALVGVAGATLAVGGASEVPVRLTLDGSALAQAGEAARAQVEQRPDMRLEPREREYRCAMAGVLAERAVAAATAAWESA